MTAAHPSSNDAGPHSQRFFETEDSAEDEWPRTPSTPDRSSRTDRLLDLVDAAQTSQSDALLVWERGLLLTERYFGQARGPIALMSITKSIVSLAIGLLIVEGKIPSVDVSLSDFHAEWRDSPYAGITLRHVLTHSSGLQHNESAAELEAQADRTFYALHRPLLLPPGSSVSYNNEAVQLLSPVVEMASGYSLDQYVARRIFDPLGIDEWSWKRDKAGTPLAYSGLSLGARDLLRIGRWLLQPGPGKALLDWVPGYLWWARTDTLYAHGWLGQYLTIRPDRQQVVVRLHRTRQGGGPDENAACGFPAFLDKLDQLGIF